MLEEEYAHKASMSASYPAFREELRGLTSDDEKLKEAGVMLSLDIAREIFRDPLLAFKNIPNKKPKTKRKAEEASSNDLTSQLTAVVRELTNLTAQIAKLLQGKTS